MTEPGAAAGPPGPPPDPAGPPGPPPGPGVAPPFVAAPVEGRRARAGMLFGVAGAAVLGCCLAGGGAFGGVVVLGQQAVNEQARTAVDEYMTAVEAQDWRDAYEQRCEADRQRESFAQYTARLTDRPVVDAYDVGDLQYGDDDSGPFADASEQLAVPVEVGYADGTDTVLHVPVVQDAGAGGFVVCGPITSD